MHAVMEEQNTVKPGPGPGQVALANSSPNMKISECRRKGSWLLSDNCSRPCLLHTCLPTQIISAGKCRAGNPFHLCLGPRKKLIWFQFLWCNFSELVCGCGCFLCNQNLLIFPRFFFLEIKTLFLIPTATSMRSDNFIKP